MPLGFDQSKVLWEHLRTAGLVNAHGKVQDTLRKALKNGTLTLPEPFAAQLPQVKEILRKLAGRLEIKNADERKQVKTRQAVLQGEDFKALWERIKYKDHVPRPVRQRGLARDLYPGDQSPELRYHQDAPAMAQGRSSPSGAPG